VGWRLVSEGALATLPRVTADRPRHTRIQAPATAPVTLASRVASITQVSSQSNQVVLRSAVRGSDEAPNHARSSSRFGSMSPSATFRLGNLSARSAMVQPLLLVGSRDDPLEREADRVAAAVVGGTAGSRPAQAIPSALHSGRVAHIQRCGPIPSADCPCHGSGAIALGQDTDEGSFSMARAAPIAGSADAAHGISRKATPLVESAVRGGSGATLESGLRPSLEARIGARFEGVRVHTDDDAAASAASIGARAYTHGSDIFFGRGEFAPGTTAGLHTLVHELVHVVQQSAGTHQFADGLVPSVEMMIQRQAIPGAAGDRERETLRVTRPFKSGEIVLNGGETVIALSDPHGAIVTVELPPPFLHAHEPFEVPAANLEVPGANPSVESGVRSQPWVPRPPGLPLDGGYQLIPLEDVPHEFIELLPDRQISIVPIPTGIGGGGGTPAVGSPGPERRAPFSMSDLVRGAGAGTFTGPLPYLKTFGFAQAGENAIGIIGIGRAGTPGNVGFGWIAEADPWGHTATYVRQGGRITVVRGFSVQSLVHAGLNEEAILAGRLGSPSAIANDIGLFTKPGARSLEYAVAPEVAEAYARGLPRPGPVRPGAGIPLEWCTGTNCVNWALETAEEGLGSRIGPASTKQGELMKFLRSNEFPEVPRATTPTPGGMSTGMKVYRWGGRVFLAIGILSVPYETATAPEGQRARTFVGASSGLGGGLAAGAAGAKLGLLCGPGAWVCSPILAIGGGLLGAIGARRVAEAIYDFFAGPGSPDTFIPNYCGECPSCHCVQRPKGFFETYPEFAPKPLNLFGPDAGRPHRLTPEETQVLLRFMEPPPGQPAGAQ